MFLARKRLTALEERLQTLERRVGYLKEGRHRHELELNEMYEKLNRLYGRIQKRQQRATREEEPPEFEEAPCPDPFTDKVLKFREARSNVLGEPQR